MCCDGNLQWLFTKSLNQNTLFKTKKLNFPAHSFTSVVNKLLSILKSLDRSIGYTNNACDTITNVILLYIYETGTRIMYGPNNVSIKSKLDQN